MISEFTQKDYDVIARDYADLREAARKRCASQEELDIVQKAFDFANDAHKGVRRRSGEPYILHPIAVAKIVVGDIGLGYKSIAAALLHDVVEDTDYTVEDISKLFGDRIALLVDGLTKMKTVLDNDAKAQNRSMQAENFKRILLTLNEDVRVVLIKLADRLHNCRTIEYMPEYKRDKILSETMFIFIPLAHRLGLYGVKSEMENIWLRYKEPQAFNDITEKINRRVTDKEKQIDEFIQPISEALTKAGFKFEIKKRVKSPYSIWHKMEGKGITFDQIYDLYAVRIIFDSPTNTKDSERDQCYHVFSIITSIYKYKPDRVRDWVKSPKSNGYEALHCTLMSNAGIWVEVQIRTARMNDIAEKGIAAHWTYKKDGFVDDDQSEMDKWISKVKEILVNPDVNALELLDIIHNDLNTSDIFVFTPKGDQIRVPKGATALDYAYILDENLGNHAIAAKINMHLVPLSQPLKGGDQVEIITAEDKTPQREWLQFVQTHAAKNSIIAFFNDERRANVEQGKKMLQKKLDELGYKFTGDVPDHLLSHFESCDTEEELYFRIGLGLVKIDDLAQMLSDSNAEKVSSWIPWLRKKRKTYVVKNGERKCLIADCCKPIPGDSIVGFLAADGTVTVHKKSCSVANDLAAKHGDRIVTPKWEEAPQKVFPVRISIKGLDRLGVINEITRYISFVMSVNIRRIEIQTENGIFFGSIDLYVQDRHDLEKLIRKLKKIEGIQSVIRTDIE